MDPVIEADNLKMHFRGCRALDGVSLRVQSGSVFALRAFPAPHPNRHSVSRASRACRWSRVPIETQYRIHQQKACDLPGIVCGPLVTAHPFLVMLCVATGADARAGRVGGLASSAAVVTM